MPAANSSNPDLAAAAQALRGCRRILLVGCSGAGKSTLSLQLSELLGQPLIHLDREFWLPGWVQTPTEEWQEKMRELVARDAWVMDGNFSATFELRVQRAEAVIMLDFPRLFCIRRVLGRVLRDYGRVRTDMTPGCPERFDWEFMVWIWNYPRRSRPKILDFLEQYRKGRMILRLTQARQISELLARLA